MFNLFKKKLSAQVVAEALWQQVETSASKMAEAQSGVKYEECVFYVGFILDVAISSALGDNPEQMSSVRNNFYLYVQQFAAERRCKLPPKGNWQAGSNMWEILGPPDESEDTVMIVLARFRLYADSLSRTWEEGKNFPPALLLGALSKSYDIILMMAATEAYIMLTKGTVDFLKSIRISA